MALRANKAEKQTLPVTTDPVEEEGFTLLASGGNKPLFDIVFIHGLQGHPETTWTHVEKVQEEQDTSYEKHNQRTALRLSAEHDDRDKDLRDMYNSTFAVLFFGTPHRGSDWVGLGRFLEKAVSALGFSTEDYNLKALQANSEILLILRESFAKMLDREAFFITSFQESQSFKSIKGLDSKIVENDSSGLDHKHERKQGINSNHVDMCKFAKSGRSYTEYQDKVHPEIHRHTERQVERSWKGILASMLHQLISQVKELQDMIIPFSLKETSESNEAKPFKQISHKWEIESLQKALLFCKNQQIVHFKMCYFIDALDENNEEERPRRDVIEYLVQLATSSIDQGYGIIKVCAASRPENDLSEILSSYNGFKMHEWTRPDIEAYVLDKLGQHPPMKAYTCSSNKDIRQRANLLIAKIVHKAQGVFLWVRLIVHDLRDSLTNGLALSIEDLEKRLEQTPEKLREFYALILKRIPAGSRRDSYAMFECVLQAQRPLTLLDLWLVLESRKMTPSEEFSKRRVSLTDNQIRSILDSGPALEKRIKTCSGGLLEVRLPVNSQLKEKFGERLFDRDSDHGQPSTRYSNDLTVSDGVIYDPEGQGYSQRSYYTPQGLDLILCTVQVLHQTVREFLSEPLILTSLLSGVKEKAEYLAAEDNANYIFLFACLLWLQYSQTGRQKLTSSYRVYIESYLLQHARMADMLRAQFYVSILDEIDTILVSEYRWTWPGDMLLDGNIHTSLDIYEYEIEELGNLDFFTFAMLQGLVNYVEQKLKDDSSLVSLHQHVKGPFLHLLVKFPVKDDQSLSATTDMLELLLKSGADVKEVDNGYTAFQSLVEYSRRWNETDLQKAVLMFLKYGADPNYGVGQGNTPPP
ncbi:MAG: hypothetical protein Q9167_005362 [Letrouitia subvulpina]